MTELAYLGTIDAAYERSFEATVTALPPGGLVLDRTLFYPVGGGQPADRGTVRGPTGPPVLIADVTKSGPSVVHRIGRGAPRPLPFGIGDRVRGEIDWVRRHTHMRLHTAQHLVSAVVFELTGLRTQKAVLGGQRGMIELERPWPDPSAWLTVVDRVRTATEPPRPVRVAFVERAAWERAPAARSGLVPLAPTVDPVRVIEIDGLDACPCGGTHVRSTGELGPLVLPAPIGVRVELTLTPDAPPTRPA